MFNINKFSVVVQIIGGHGQGFFLTHLYLKYRILFLKTKPKVQLIKLLDKEKAYYIFGRKGIK
jgi:hypothetical protein